MVELVVLCVDVQGTANREQKKLDRQGLDLVCCCPGHWVAVVVLYHPLSIGQLLVDLELDIAHFLLYSPTVVGL